MKIPNRRRGKSALLDLFLIALVIFVGYLLYRRGDFNRFLPPEWQTKLASTTPATPAPASPVQQSSVTQAAPAVPAPENTPAAVEATATPSMAQSTPPPPAAEEKIVLTQVDHRYWPQQVKLLRCIEFPVIYNGRPVGTALAPAGLPVKLVDARGDQVMVQNGEATKWLAVNDTDVIARVRDTMRILSLPTGATPAPAVR